MKTAFDIIRCMRLLAAFVLLPAMAFCVTVESLPPSAYAAAEIGEVVLVEGWRPGFAVEVR